MLFYVSVCALVCLFVLVSVYVNVCVFARRCVFVHLFGYVFASLFVYLCKCACGCVRACLFVCGSLRFYVCVFVCLRGRLFMCCPARLIVCVSACAFARSPVRSFSVLVSVWALDKPETLFHYLKGCIYVTSLREVDERTPKQERIYQQCSRIVDNIGAEMRRHMNKWLKRCIEAKPTKLPKPRPGQTHKPVKIVGLRKLPTQ